MATCQAPRKPYHQLSMHSLTHFLFLTLIPVIIKPFFSSSVLNLQQLKVKQPVLTVGEIRRGFNYSSCHIKSQLRRTERWCVTQWFIYGIIYLQMAIWHCIWDHHSTFIYGVAETSARHTASNCRMNPLSSQGFNHEVSIISTFFLHVC